MFLAKFRQFKVCGLHGRKIPPHQARLFLESLETRENLSVSFLVTSVSDSGPGTLRAAVSAANAASSSAEIYFAPELAHKVIHLQTNDTSSSDSKSYGATALRINNTVTIYGTGQILDALGIHRHFYVTFSGNLTLSGLELTDGTAAGGDGGEGWNGGGGGAGFGGSIFNIGTLTVEGCEFDSNGAFGGNGGSNPNGILGGGGGGGMSGSGNDGSGNSGGDGGGDRGGVGGEDGASDGFTGGGGGGGDSTHNGGNGGFGGGGGGAGRNTSATGLGGGSAFGGGGGGGNVRTAGGVTGGLGSYYAGDGGYGSSGGAGGGGAGIGGAVFNVGSASFRNCTFDHYSALGGSGGTGIGVNAGGGGGGAAVGGAIFNDCGFMTVEQCTFVSNSVSQGSNGTSTGTGVTGTGSAAHGSAVANYAETVHFPENNTTSKLKLSNCILAAGSGAELVSNRQTGTGSAILTASAPNIVFGSAAYNSGGGSVDSSGIRNVDPLLGTRSDYGGICENLFSSHQQSGPGRRNLECKPDCGFRRTWGCT